MVINSFISTFDNFFTQQECEYFISRFESAPRNKIDFKKVNNSIYPERLVIRLSDDSTIKYTFIGINDVLGDDIDKYEKVVQVFKFYTNDLIGPHYDYVKYNVNDYAMVIDTFGDRVQTFMIYLNTPPQGGGLQFPNVSIDILPQEGKLLHYRTKDITNVVINDSIHNTLPLIEGPLYVIVGHIRSKKQPF